MTINIVYSLNDEYASGAACSIKSLCSNTHGTRDMVIYILFSELSNDNAVRFEQLSKECHVDIRLKKIKPEKHIAKNCFYTVNYLTCEMYFRMFRADILPKEEKALYLDCDTIITGDIVDLYMTDISDFILGAVYDYPNILREKELKQIEIDKGSYFNSGVLLVNLKRFREENILERSLNYLKYHTELKCPDQDTLNIICDGKVKLLDERWNFQWGHCIDKFVFLNDEEARKYKNIRDNFFLIHFTSPKKPWNSFVCPELGIFFWKYALDTPFKEILSINMIAKAPCSYLEDNIGHIINERFFTGKIGFKYIIKFFKSWLHHKVKKLRF